MNLRQLQCFLAVAEEHNSPVLPIACTSNNRVRSIDPTYRQVEFRFTVASPVSSSTVAAHRSPLPTRHEITIPVRGAATYWVLGR